jgi:hypothetical protein
LEDALLCEFCDKKIQAPLEISHRDNNRICKVELCIPCIQELYHGSSEALCPECFEFTDKEILLEKIQNEPKGRSQPYMEEKITYGSKKPIYEE